MMTMKYPRILEIASNNLALYSDYSPELIDFARFLLIIMPEERPTIDKVRQHPLIMTEMDKLMKQLVRENDKYIEE